MGWMGLGILVRGRAEDTVQHEENHDTEDNRAGVRNSRHDEPDDSIIVGLNVLVELVPILADLGEVTEGHRGDEDAYECNKDGTAMPTPLAGTDNHVRVLHARARMSVVVRLADMDIVCRAESALLTSRRWVGHAQERQYSRGWRG